MNIGMCAGLTMAQFVRQVGYDYLEPPLNAVTALSDEAFEAACKQVFDAGITCDAFNCLLPQSIRILGQEANETEIHAYAEKAFARAARLSGKIVVFGSGGARRIPAGMCRSEALTQLRAVLRIFGETALKYGILIAIEPLNPKETDLVNTVKEGLQLAESLDYPAIKLLADYYHMQLTHESLSILAEAKPFLIHCHIACGKERQFPSEMNRHQTAAFLNALSEVGYTGRVSVEGVTDRFEADAAASLVLMRELV